MSELKVEDSLSFKDNKVVTVKQALEESLMSDPDQGGYLEYLDDKVKKMECLLLALAARGVNSAGDLNALLDCGNRYKILP